MPPHLVEKVLAQFVPAPHELLQPGWARARNNGLYCLVRPARGAASNGRARDAPYLAGLLWAYRRIGPAAPGAGERPESFTFGDTGDKAGPSGGRRAAWSPRLSAKRLASARVRYVSGSEGQH